MKKFLAGLIMGVFVAMGIPAFADTMIGKKVDVTYPLFIDGMRAQKDVVAIEGTSYLPVRAASELFGYNTKWDDVKKEVHLEKVMPQSMSVKLPVMDYYVRSNDFKVGGGEGKQELIFVDNEWHTRPSLISFYATVTFENKILTVEAPGYEVVTIDGQQEYPAVGMGGFIYKGRTFVKLSAIGLKATVSGDSILLEKL